MSPTKAPTQTFEEARYLRRLVEKRTPIEIKLVDGGNVRGYIEYWDSRFIRLTRTDGPNLFIFKHEIAWFHELDSLD